MNGTVEKFGKRASSFYLSVMNYKMPVICQFRTGSPKGSDFFSLHPENKILLPLRVVQKKKDPS